MRPYEEYAEKALSRLTTFQYTVETTTGDFLNEPATTLLVSELRCMLKDAWIAGISYSLKLIEETERSPFRPPFLPFNGGDKISLPVIYGRIDTDQEQILGGKLSE